VPSYAHPKPPASLIPATELGVRPRPGAFEAPTGAEILYSFTARTVGPRRTRRRPGCPKARRFGGKAAAGRGAPCLPTALRLSCPPRLGHAGLRLAKAQPVVMVSERGWTRFGVHGDQFTTFLDCFARKDFFGFF